MLSPVSGNASSPEVFASSPPRRPRLTECLLLNECRRRPPCQTEWLPCLCGRGVPGGRSAQSLSTLRVASKMRLHAVLFCLVCQFPSGLPYPQGKCFYILYFYRFLLCVSFGCRPLDESVTSAYVESFVDTGSFTPHETLFCSNLQYVLNLHFLLLILDFWINYKSTQALLNKNKYFKFVRTPFCRNIYYTFRYQNTLGLWF